MNKLHEINIFINNVKADIFSQESLNLRFNNTFADPSKIGTIQTEYSFSFTLPVTLTNSKIFDYANILSKRNKFNKRFKTHVNADGILIFDGDLILTNITKEGYKCNLYINKVNTINKIFGDTTLNEITNWTIDYDQNNTINEINHITDICYPDADIFFPLVSYGMFQKKETSNKTYTSKYLIDDYATLYNENFYPSHNLLKLVEKCFQHKGYNVNGDIFDDDVLKHIYTSTHLTNEQDPIYNYGDEKMGKLKFTHQWSNYGFEITDRGTNKKVAAAAIETTLDTPLFFAGYNSSRYDTSSEGYYNYKYNNVYDVWSSSLMSNLTFEKENNVLWRQNRIVAPTDGFYKISVNLDYKIDQSEQFVRYVYELPEREAEVQLVSINTGSTWTFTDFCTEFQLVKNSEDGMDCKNIFPDNVDIVTESNYNTYSAYPHEKKGNYILSTDKIPYPYGYTPQNNKTLLYDARVNKNFILGCTTSGIYNLTSVIKNGKSWDINCTDTAMARYESEPYYGIAIEEREDDGSARKNWLIKPYITSDDNIYGVNTLPNSKMSITRNNDTASAHIEAIVYLQKNDTLHLKMLQRQWMNSTTETSRTIQNDAKIDLTATVEFECFSPNDLPITSDKFDWNTETRFPKQLDLAQFLSSEEKMSDFINNFIKEFNLSFSQQGNDIIINKQKIDYSVKNAVNLTNRISNDEIEMAYIDYPSQMSVQYTVDEEERGFYISAEKNATDEQILSNDWKDYADKGYDIIQIFDDEYATESVVTTKTSYCWYDNFKITQDGQSEKTVSLPIIAKDEWMIDGFKDAELMKEDGMNLKRRYWFPSTLTTSYVLLNGDKDRKTYIKLCSNKYYDTDLSYKISDNETLLTRYFNVFYDADTNYIIFEAYLTTEEYIQIKNGSNIIIDDDVYIPIELQGYDCSGNNKTKITAIKK